MYDIIIIGGGCAGLTAGIYAKEANKSVLILEKMGAGGQLNNIFNVTNYPGFESINGYELAEKMHLQATRLGAEIKNEEVTQVDFSKDIKIVKTNYNEYMSKNVIIATGASARKLNVYDEENFYGRGLSYCATCDGNLFRNKTVAVVGGGNTSIDDCLYLSNIAKKIYLIHRREVFTANEKELNKVKALEKNDGVVEIKSNMIVTKLFGDNVLKQIELTNTKTNTKETIDVDGLFVAIGRKPDTELFEGKLELDASGFIKTNENMETSVNGVYAVGDVRSTNLRQIITACADGAIAVSNIVKKN